MTRILKIRNQLKNKMMNVNLLTKTTLFGFAFFSALISVSANLPVVPPGTPGTEKTIQTYFKFPSFLLPQAEQKTIQSRKVEVLFTTDKNGDVNFVLAKTNDNDLRKEVENQFYQLRLPKVPAEVVHSVVLDFRTK